MVSNEPSASEEKEQCIDVVPMTAIEKEYKCDGLAISGPLTTAQTMAANR